MSNATFTFGRFNPPTEEGHGKLVSAVQAHAEQTSGQHYVFPTHSQDKKKNPMAHEDKVGAMRKLFPSANIVSHDKVRTAMDAMKHLESKGHTNVTMVVGSDRVDEFHKLLNTYRTKEYPKIKKINVVSAGHRDPDAEGAEGMSASKLRGLVAAGKKKEFVSHYSDPKLGAHIHDKVKAGMQMESTNPVGIFLLGGPGSGKDYVLNNIFSRFDLTEVQVDQIINGSAAELVEQKKNIVINGAIDADKMAIVESILDGYDLDTVYVSVTNRVSRLRNGLRDNPLIENKRIQRFLAAEKLAESIEGAFVFNNSINLNESTEMERLFFGSQIEKLLARLVEQGLKLQETPEPKSFVAIKEKYSRSPAQQAAIAIAMKKAGKKPKNMKEDIRYAERTQFPPMESLKLHAERIAEKHSVSPAEVLDQLAIGISVEYGNTHNYDKATELALKNVETECNYYSKNTTVQEQLKRPKVPAMQYVPSEAEKQKASEVKSRKDRVRHRWLHHSQKEVHGIAKEEKEPVEAMKLGIQAAKKYMHNAGDTGVPAQEEKEFASVRHHKSGLPSKYVKGLTPAEIKAKKAHIEKNEKLSDKDPEAYKDMPGDKRIRAKGIPLSKYTKKYRAMYGEETEPKDQKPHLTVDSIAKKHGVSVDDIQKEFEMGQKVEHEHTQDADRAADIALNHLGEIPDYYSRLDKMEKQAKNIGEATEQKIKVGDTVKYKYTLAGNKNKVRSGKVVHVGKNFLNVQQELPFKNKMHHTINPSDVVNEEMELEEGKYASTIAAIASSAYEPKIGDNVRTRKGGQIPGKVEKIEGDKVYFRHPEGKLYTTHSGNLMREEVELDEGAADTSLAKKAEKSGVSLSTLRKVYNRGVAAWNSGHRPGTTPAQWGHARVNSYITKGKTYHTADKDLREAEGDPLPPVLPKVRRSGGITRVQDAQQRNRTTAKAVGALEEDVDTLFERQFDGTSSYREYAIAMTPGQSQEIKDASGNTQKIDGEEQCGCGGGCDCNAVQNSPTGASGNRITRSLRDIKEANKKAESEKEIVNLDPVIDTKRKKGSKPRPIDTFDSTLQGMPTVSTAFAEATEDDHDDEFQAMVKRLQQKAEQQKKLEAQGKKPKTVYDEKTGKYRVSFEEGKETESVSLEEAVQFHIENKVSFTENVFRPGSDMFFSMINEAKRLYKEGKYTPADEFEKDLLESDIGEIAEYEGRAVVLDYPVEEGLEEACWSGYTQKGMKKKGDKMVPNCVPVSEESDLPVTRHKSPYEGAEVGEYTEHFPGSPISAQKFAKHIISKGGSARIGVRGQDHYVYHKGAGPISSADWRKSLKEESDPTNGRGIGKPFRKGGGGAVYVKSGDSVRLVNFSQSGMKKRYMEPGRLKSFMARHHCLTNNDKTSASYWACRWPRYFSNSGRMWW